MSYDYSENILVQESAGNLLHDELAGKLNLPITRKCRCKPAHSEEPAIMKYYLFVTFKQH